MSAFEIKDGEIIIKNFDETRNELRAKWSREFVGIDLSPTSVDGHHLDLEARTITSTNQALQSALANLDRRSAKGRFLEILAAFLGLSRLSAEYSRPTIYFHGTAGTEIPQGTIVTFEGSPFTFSLDESITLDASGNGSGHCTCNSAGYVELYIGQWQMVSTTPSGVTCECKTKSGSGRDAENDEQLLQRMDSAENQGLSTPDGMETYLRNAISPSVIVVSNPEDFEVGGIPPHRFRVIVPNGIGPSSDNIAQAIHDSKPFGIKSFGNNSGTAISSVTGQKYTEYYSVPVEQKIKAKITLSEYDEEVFPSNGLELVKKEIVKWSESEFTTGKDVICMRFIIPIMNVPGILSAEIEVANLNSSVWKSDKLNVNSEHYATIDEENIDVRFG